MEFTQAGFKAGFEPETAAKKTAAVDDWCGVNGGGSGDDLFVDELLDFTNGFSETEEQPPEEPPENKPGNRKTGPSSFEKQPTPQPENRSLSAGDDFGSLHESEISVQGLESLEWLSHFVEDSFPDYSLAGKFPPQPTVNRPKPAAATQERSCFVTPVQTKVRTKRVRTGARVLPVSSPSSTEPSTSSSSLTSSTTSFSPPNKQRKKLAEGGGAVAEAAARRCTHCGVTKTPQWRAGPLGLKTLCNACGVRYKSGRLLPEYRPACSPTFSSELHSNNHRKVLEMRRKKEVESEAAPPVQNF